MRILVFVALLCVMGVPLVSQQQQQPPQFRAGVAVTRLEVTVLHSRTRALITGLTADDFVVRVNGQVQPIVALAEVAVPGVGTFAAPAMIEAARDVASNELVNPRLFVLILNDAVGGLDPYYRSTGKAIAQRFIDLLGPEDLVSVIFVRDNRYAQDLTQDRVLLRRAVEEYRPLPLPQADQHTTRVLLKTLEFLRPISRYRRAVVFITPSANGGELDTEDLKDFTSRADAFHELDVAAVSAGAGLSHIPVYTFSAQGLQAPTAADMKRLNARELSSPHSRFDSHVETLRTIAGLTGGRATVATNTPADGVPAMFNELSSYYALAYEQTHPADGRLRRLDVQVTRPDALVVSSRLVLAPTKAASPAADTYVMRTGLFEALESPLSMGALPLRLSALPVAVSGARDQAVAFTLGLPRVSAAEQFRVRMLVFDGEGRREILDTSRTVDIARGTPEGDAPELAMRVSLRPGRYNVRVVTERASDDNAGTVHATIAVPDFAREPLSLSGVAIGRGDGRRIAGRAELEGLLPFAPTATRTFEPGDRVGALLRVHQASNRAAAPVTMATSITDAMGDVLRTESRVIEASAFEDGVAGHRYEVPLDLPSGVYLLRFVATTANATAQREVRLSVR